MAPVRPDGPEWPHTQVGIWCIVGWVSLSSVSHLQESIPDFLTELQGVLRELKQNPQIFLRPSSSSGRAQFYHILLIKENLKASSDLKRNGGRHHLLIWKSTSHLAKKHAYKEKGLFVALFCNQPQIYTNHVYDHLDA